MTPRTLFDKIWDAHVVMQEPGGPALLYVDLHLVHEVTSPQAFEGLRLEGRQRAPAGTGCCHDGPQRPDHRRRGVGCRRHEPGPDGGAAPQLRRQRHRLLRRRTSLPGHRPRDRSGARPHRARHHHRLRRLAHGHPRGLRRIRARDRHLRGRARAGDAVPAPDATAHDGGAHRRGASRWASRPRTRRSASSTSSARRAPRVTSSSTRGRSCADSRWSSA